MRDDELLDELLNADNEADALAALESRGLLADESRWRYLGDIPNNKSIVLGQQSNPMAALVEKYTNAGDALLLRGCRAEGVDPRDPKKAPPAMAEAAKRYFGDVAAMTKDERRTLAEDNLLLFATGSKSRPCISLYDNGEGQLAKDFPDTFCSLIFGAKTKSSYKGAIPFVQGRFNMGGTGVLRFCSEKRKLQLIVSRSPVDVVGSDDHEWAYTIMCYFDSKDNPSWKYLVGPDGEVPTAGRSPLHLVPRKKAKSGKICPPRERAVDSGTLLKLYDFQAPRSNICGELFKKLCEYLIQPVLPLRIIECRESYKAKVTGVMLWDRLGALLEKNELEEGSETGIGVLVPLSTGEQVPGQVLVFKPKTGKKKAADDTDDVRVGLRAMINGQSHARRGPEFFRRVKVDKEHIAGSMLVALDCTALGQGSRDDLFMSDRERFSDSPLRDELFRSLEDILRSDPLLKKLNTKRYEEKIKNAVSDDDGIKAMADLLSSDPDLAELFGGEKKGPIGKTSPVKGDDDSDVDLDGDGDGVVDPDPDDFKGEYLPSYFRRADGSTEVDISLPENGVASTSFVTDVENNYFARTHDRGTLFSLGDIAPAQRLYNGRMTLTFRAPKGAKAGEVKQSVVRITDPTDSGPFTLKTTATIVEPEAKKKRKPKGKGHKAKEGKRPASPNIIPVEGDVTEPAISVNRTPKDELQILVNMKAEALNDAKMKRPPEESAAVEFVYKYGLALIVMAMVESEKDTSEWAEDEAGIRESIGDRVSGLARVIVPLCLTLPNKIPKVS